MLEAETVQPPAPDFFSGLRHLCDRYGALLVLDEMITAFRWHERGAQFIYDIRPDLSTFGKGIADGFPLSALTGRRDVMRLGGFVDDVDRVFLLSQTAGAPPWALAAMLTVIETCQREQISAQLQQIGADLRRRIEEVVADAGLSSYFQLRGRDSNLVCVARDATGQPSQSFRTLVLQELLDHGILHRRSWSALPTIQRRSNRPSTRSRNSSGIQACSGIGHRKRAAGQASSASYSGAQLSQLAVVC